MYRGSARASASDWCKNRQCHVLRGDVCLLIQLRAGLQKSTSNEGVTDVFRCHSPIALFADQSFCVDIKTRSSRLTQGVTESTAWRLRDFRIRSHEQAARTDGGQSAHVLVAFDAVDRYTRTVRRSCEAIAQGATSSQTSPCTRCRQEEQVNHGCHRSFVRRATLASELDARRSSQPVSQVFRSSSFAAEHLSDRPIHPRYTNEKARLAARGRAEDQTRCR